MNDKKSILKGILGLSLYFILNFFTYLPLYLLGISSSNLGVTGRVIYVTIYEFLTLLIIFMIFNKEIVKDFKIFKQNFKKFFNKYFKYWFLLLFLMITSNIIIQIIYPGSSSGNEDSIRKTFELAPFYTFISASLFAPFVEEIIFRMSIRKIFKNKYLFILLSGLIFGGLHLLGNVNTPYDYLYLLPYCLPGFVLAYVYYKSDNIFTSLGIHFIHNTVLLIIQILSL